ncbi:MAG TPA: 8-amino-7-oxononanoate synthase [Accumulibacter sp.]|nr:8-amino-7-oxononanoate synthase [Accumulibacter sp.]
MIVDELQQALSALRADGLQRQRRTLQTPCGPLAEVDGRQLISFCSNDYLGLADDPMLIEAACAGARRWGVGSGASHLVSGHLAPHAALEDQLAEFSGFDRALLFSTGYLANLAIIPTLVGRGDAVFADRLNHASLIDAVQLSRADSQRYAHGDVEALERLLAASTAKRKLIVSDAVFSMDGDLAPLPALLTLAERFDAWLVIDDAHGFGVLGRQGRGTVDHFRLPASRRLLYMGTLGKAAGGSGAFVAGDATVIEWLTQRARSYIFTTAGSPMVACALSASLRLIAEGDARRHHLWQLTAQLRDGLAKSGWRLLPSPTAIQPLIVGDNQRALQLATALYERGLWVPAIRPPTVPVGTARLRISLTAAHQPTQVASLVDALRELA